MRVDRQQTLEEKLDEILKSSQAAQKAAESANSYLFWMNVGWYARIIFQVIVVRLLAHEMFKAQPLDTGASDEPSSRWLCATFKFTACIAAYYVHTTPRPLPSGRRSRRGGLRGDRAPLADPYTWSRHQSSSR